MKTLWLLTEERPKKQSILKILGLLKQINLSPTDIRIVPQLDNDGKFLFVYQVLGLDQYYKEVRIKIISGKSSFVDFLVFETDHEPNIKDIPILAVEETKTGDNESRNTAVYQRATKFVYMRHFFPTTRMIMFYNRDYNKDKTSTTFVFGMRLLKTLGVEILGGNQSGQIFESFADYHDLINLKNQMPAPLSGTPIRIKEETDKIVISAKLSKRQNKGISHDPNIGFLAIVSQCLRNLNCQLPIVISEHEVDGAKVGKKNKFIQLATELDISLQGVALPKSNITMDKDYWSYDQSGEKIGTIFSHILCEEFGDFSAIYENHGGCERGYLTDNLGNPITIHKYKNKELYKAGDLDQIVHIPDLILKDNRKLFIINAEGKTASHLESGISDLKNYDFIENEYLKKIYGDDIEVCRTVIIFGQTNKFIPDSVGIYLKSNGEIICGKDPAIFKTSIDKLHEFLKIPKKEVT